MLAKMSGVCASLARAGVGGHGDTERGRRALWRQPRLCLAAALALLSAWANRRGGAGQSCTAALGRATRDAAGACCLGARADAGAAVPVGERRARRWGRAATMQKTLRRFDLTLKKTLPASEQQRSEVAHGLGGRGSTSWQKRG